MQLDPQEYLKKLVEVYQGQCNQYLQERITLQAQLDSVLKEIEKLETKLKQLDPKMNEVVDVNTNTDT